uniref:Protein kinase domain-containing protein n=1 Tax=Kalanchoe fedtschenkoi TaxID=63787 RepID=A0A7N0TLY2_KALFE
MCKTKMATDAAEPTRSPRTSRATLQSPRTPPGRSAGPSNSQRPAASSSARTSTPPPAAAARSSPSTSFSSYPSTSIHYSSSTGPGGFDKDSKNSLSSLTSLSSLRDTLPETPIVYDISEIRSATNSFLAKRYSSSTTPSWLCTLRSKEVLIFQRKSRTAMSTFDLQKKLSVICKSHYSSIIKLLGACISGEQHIYLVYEFVHGASLSSCLRSSRNPNFTVLSTWLSRMQVATDLAHALDYIHTNMNFVHNHVKSSSVIVTEPSFNAKICHFGAAQLCGEVGNSEDDEENLQKRPEEEIASATSPISSEPSRSTDRKAPQFQGTVGYMSPEFQASGVGTKKSDVYAFGVVILELVSGEEPYKYRVDKESKEIKRTSVIDTAADAVAEGGDDGDGGGLGKEARVRRWVDRRLRDSFPVEVAEKATRVALDCVHVDVDRRPDMRRVAGKISKLYLDSVKWSNSLKMPTDMISVSLAPR